MPSCVAAISFSGSISRIAWLISSASPTLRRPPSAAERVRSSARELVMETGHAFFLDSDHAACRRYCCGETPRMRLKAVESANGGAVADLRGDGADGRARLEQQVGGEGDPPAGEEAHRRLADELVEAAGERGARDPGGARPARPPSTAAPGCCGASATPGRRSGRRRRGTSPGASASGRANQARRTAISSRSSSRSSTASWPGLVLDDLVGQQRDQRGVRAPPRRARAAPAGRAAARRLTSPSSW